MTRWAAWDAIVAYLRTVPGIAHEVPAHQEPWEAPPEPAVPVDPATIPEPPADHPRHESAMRGRYLAAMAGMCMECHTPPIGTDDLLPRPIDMTRPFAGGLQLMLPMPSGPVGLYARTTEQPNSRTPSRSRASRHTRLFMPLIWRMNVNGRESMGAAPPPMTDETGIARYEAEFFLYQTEDGNTRVEVRFHGDTAWLTQASLAELYQTTPQNITQHIATIYEEGELGERATCKPFLQVRQEGKRRVQRSLKHYSLPMILAVGYRVRSHRGTQFRQWATSRLEEYLIKGFTLDDERLKRAGGESYFDELLERIRDIRSSERVFWRKVLDIYATSIDYDPGVEASQRFFATVQNKMHWAAHGQTAAEIIARRADATKPNMGIMTWTGERPRKADAKVAKNYLEQEELGILNRIVNAYLEFAELQAINRKPMYMADWIRKLDDFLRLSDRDVLTHTGRVSHDDAVAKAKLEYDRFAATRRALPSPVERHFDEAVRNVKQLEKQRPPAERLDTDKRTAPRKRTK